MSDHLDRVLEFVEWQQLREAVAGRTQSGPGALRARELLPSDDPDEVARLQARTAEARALVERVDLVDLERVIDVATLFQRLQRMERGLVAREVRAIAQTILAGRDARVSFAGSPSLAELVAMPEEEALADVALALEVVAAIGPYGVVETSASERLGLLRSDIEAARDRLKHEVTQMALDRGLLMILAQTRPADFNGTPCLLVKPDQVRRVAGPIRGEAPDGMLFVEPDRLQVHYNRVRHLEHDERMEMTRIVRGFAERLVLRREAHERLADGLVTADIHLALARWARDLHLVPPAFGDGIRLELRRACHPLLDPATCVPLDLVLDHDRRMLVISGPNGGGKTVAMKTVALCCLLAQTGSWIPAATGTVLPRLRVFLAVADSRSSVVVGLSHFQAHAKDLAEVARAVTARSLVLLDEIGHGTDPGEAGALGQAFLEHVLGERDALALVTTHLAPLKSFAAKTPGVLNASVALDPSGKPSFLLEVGRSGTSYALDMARAAGLPESIVARAEVLHRG